MDSLYVTWPTVSPTLPDLPDSRSIEPMDAFSFGQPARGLRALRQEWAPAFDLFDVHRPEDSPPTPFVLAKLVGLVICLTVFAGVLLGTVGRVMVESFFGVLGP
jgi:hypothetical protein